jgi:hypothetical protein
VLIAVQSTARGHRERRGEVLCSGSAVCIHRDSNQIMWCADIALCGTNS